MESELEEISQLNRKEGRRIDRENKRDRVITEIAFKIKEEVTEILIDIMREEFRHIIRTEMRKAMKEVYLEVLIEKELLETVQYIQRGEQMLNGQIDISNKKRQDKHRQRHWSDIQKENDYNKQNKEQVGRKKTNRAETRTEGSEVLQLMLMNLESEARDGGEGGQDCNIHSENKDAPMGH